MKVMTGLKTLLGPDRAARLITETTAFLAAHPRLKQLFEAPGLGAQAGGRVCSRRVGYGDAIRRAHPRSRMTVARVMTHGAELPCT